MADDAIGLRLRPAARNDMDLVLAGTHELAGVEGRPDAVTTDAAGLWRLLTTPGVAAECVVLERIGPRGPEPIGHAWFFVHASTFSGERWLYVEDIVVQAPFRGAGLGRLAMAALARRARERGCSGMHWSVVEGNAGAVRCYQGLDAMPKAGSRQFKLEGEPKVAMITRSPARALWAAAPLMHTTPDPDWPRRA